MIRRVSPYLNFLFSCGILVLGPYRYKEPLELLTLKQKNMNSQPTKFCNVLEMCHAMMFPLSMLEQVFAFFHNHAREHIINIVKAIICPSV